VDGGLALHEVLTSTVRDVATWQLAQVSVERCGKQHWLYIVRWDSIENSRDCLLVPVLLSGKALIPVAGDDEKKLGDSPSN